MTAENLIQIQDTKVESEKPISPVQQAVGALAIACFDRTLAKGEDIEFLSLGIVIKGDKIPVEPSEPHHE